MFLFCIVDTRVPFISMLTVLKVELCQNKLVTQEAYSPIVNEGVVLNVQHLWFTDIPTPVGLKGVVVPKTIIVCIVVH